MGDTRQPPPLPQEWDWLAVAFNEKTERLCAANVERNETDRWTVELALILGISIETGFEDVREQYREIRRRILASEQPPHDTTP
jgi:hypothetical protein